MRVFAISDLHVDHSANARWVEDISRMDYGDDVLIVAGDVSDSSHLLERTFRLLAKRFRQVLYVPGNHDLWVIRDKTIRTSLEKFAHVCEIARQCDVATVPVHFGPLSIVPLLGWYDYSFGPPTDDLRAIWMDYRACVWPETFTSADINSLFLEMNEPALTIGNRSVISFSHFLPRIDVMPSYIPAQHRVIFPVLGSHALDLQIRRLRSSLHVYGHSHVQRRVTVNGVTYVNNCLAYPSERHIAARSLVCVYDGTQVLGRHDGVGDRSADARR